MKNKTKKLWTTSMMRLWVATTFVCLCFLTPSFIGCAKKEVIALPDSRIVQTLPVNHCLPCHARYFEGRMIIDKGYLLDIFRILEEK
jgi:hypothetical protein